MTFLQYLKRIHLFLGLGSRGNTAKPGTVPTASAGQVDELAELVEWGIMALTNFQMLQPWGWMIRPGTLAFTTGDPQVVPTATLQNFRELVPFKDGLRKYLLSYITVASADMVANGDFSAAGGWTAGSGWTVTTVATATTSSGALVNDTPAASGRTYRIQYDVTRSAGAVQMSFGGATGASRTSTGTFVDYVTTSSTTALTFTGTAFSGTIDNVVISGGATAEQRVYEVPWDQFRGYLDRSDVQSGRPLYYTMTPDNEMRVYPTPDQGYTVRFDYLYKPKIYTTADDALNLEDYPTVDNGGNTIAGRGLPPEHHELVAWYAVRYWAETRGKLDTYQMADKRVRELSGPLKLRFLPTARI